MRMPIRVIIADDEELFATGVKAALESYPNVALKVRTITETVDAVFDAIRAFDADILFLDLDWFGEKTAGAEIIGRILNIKPLLPIVAISAYPALVQPARKAGAREARIKQGLSGETLLKLIVNVLAADEFALLSENLKKIYAEFQTSKSDGEIKKAVRFQKQNRLRQTLQQHHRQLQKLKEQIALLGVSNSALSLKIKDTEEMLAQMEKELFKLEKGGVKNGGEN